MQNKLANFFLDTLFPISCVFCQEGNQWICPTCFLKIKTINTQVCPYCERETTDFGKICKKCSRAFLKKNQAVPLDALIISSKYSESGISRLIKLYKYNFIEELGSFLGEILLQTVAKNELPVPDLIIPIPLHPRRLRWRGFNQSEKLADFLGKNLTPGFPILVGNNMLTRTKYTVPQMKIGNYQERKRNVSGIFLITDICKQAFRDKKILLIDDVATTGATLFEAGKILKENGAKKVFGAVIARQEIT